MSGYSDLAKRSSERSNQPSSGIIRVDKPRQSKEVPIPEPQEEEEVVDVPLDKLIEKLIDRMDFLHYEVMDELKRIEPVVKIETKLITKYIPCEVIKSRDRLIYKSLIGKKTFISKDDVVTNEEGDVVEE